MSASNNWPINTGRDGVAVTATTAGTATQIVPSGNTAQLIAPDVMIDNPGPSDVYVQAGGASTLATALSMRVPANSLQPYQKGQTTHLAVYCRSGTQVVTVHVGDGA